MYIIINIIILSRTNESKYFYTKYKNNEIVSQKETIHWSNDVLSCDNEIVSHWDVKLK